jgi:hypothetical protein
MIVEILAVHTSESLCRLPTHNLPHAKQSPGPYPDLSTPQLPPEHYPGPSPDLHRNTYTVPRQTCQPLPPSHTCARLDHSPGPYLAKSSALTLSDPSTAQQNMYVCTSTTRRNLHLFQLPTD